MTHHLNVFFFDIYPYICAAVFFLGSWLRYDYGQYTWRASSSQLLEQARHELGFQPVPHRYSGDFLRASVRHVDPALDVRLVPALWAVKQQLAMIAGGSAAC
ncbi:Respiratory nitrate reductase 2 gamma chain [Leclercia adecarboxylata]|uniref:Respiratory nitrate reductase 2 gamma chain n=1 Tax=Leclercia adecarboxylata TaxID=83655 RepID=A0A4U9HUU2_9ENTR|nr:Respiratory nitrate reductase 2 gamma chain [Leclercia adecarboxylata]